MKIMKLKIIGILSFVLFFCLLFASGFLTSNFASAQELNLITTRTEFLNALRDAKDNDTLLVGDIDFNLNSSGAVNDAERITIEKSIIIKNGKESGIAEFKGASFILKGSLDNSMPLNYQFIGISFNDYINTDEIRSEDWDITSDGSGEPVRDTSILCQYAIELKNTVNVKFSECTIKNYMCEYGAALRANYSEDVNQDGRRADITLDKCVIKDNATRCKGGAIYLAGYLKNITFTAIDTKFNNNVIGPEGFNLMGGGGAIHGRGVKIELQNCELKNNQANKRYANEDTIPDFDNMSGGAIYCTDSADLTMNNCLVTQNSASQGGGICIDDATCYLDGCVVSHNRSATIIGTTKSVPSEGMANQGMGCGGGIFFNGDLTLGLVNTTVAYNSAETAMGAIYAQQYVNGAITLSFCTVYGNECDLEKSDYRNHDDTTYDGFIRPLDFYDIVNVNTYGCVVIDDLYKNDIPKHEYSTQENNYNYFADIEQAKLDGYAITHVEGEHEHINLNTNDIVPLDFVKGKLGDRNYYGNFTIGANVNDVKYNFFMDGALKESVILSSGIVPTMPSFEKSGYTLTTWSLADYLDYQADRTFIVGNATESVDLHAVFVPNTYMVTYHFGEAKEVIEQTYGTELTPPTPQERNGYTFVGWFTAENGKGDKVVSGTLFQTASDITYFAYYEKDFPIFYVIISIVAGVLVIGMTILTGFAIYRRKHPHVIPVTIDGAMQVPKELPDTSILSPREKEVLELLLQGKQRNEIATTLYISENTVKKNISSIYTKLNVSSRNELFALFK